MKLIGFHNHLGVTPSFLTPVFTDATQNDDFFIQIEQRNSEKIDSFEQVSIEGELVTYNKNIYKGVGDDFIFAIQIDPKNLFYGSLNELRLYCEKLDLSSFPSSFNLALTSLIFQPEESSLHMQEFLESLSEKVSTENAFTFLNSAVSMRGWEKLDENLEKVNSNHLVDRQDIFRVSFFIDSASKISLMIPDGLNLPDALAADEVLDDLNEEYELIISNFRNLSILGSADSAEDNPPDNGKDDNETIPSRFIQLISEMSRQEERLAFLLCSLLEFPNYTFEFLSYHDRAKSANSGIQLLRNYLIKDQKRTERSLALDSATPTPTPTISNKYVGKYDESLLQILSHIVWGWKTGDRALFQFYLYKWGSNHNTLLSIIDEVFWKYRGFYYLKDSILNIIRKRDVYAINYFFEVDISDAYFKLFEFEEEVEYLLRHHGWTKKLPIYSEPVEIEMQL